MNSNKFILLTTLLLFSATQSGFSQIHVEKDEFTSKNSYEFEEPVSLWVENKTKETASITAKYSEGVFTFVILTSFVEDADHAYMLIGGEKLLNFGESLQKEIQGEINGETRIWYIKLDKNEFQKIANSKKLRIRIAGTIYDVPNNAMILLRQILEKIKLAH